MRIMTQDQVDAHPEMMVGPEDRDPVMGRWYHGVTREGVGALAQYMGWGEFLSGDGSVIDMTRYDFLVEHL